MDNATNDAREGGDGPSQDKTPMTIECEVPEDEEYVVEAVIGRKFREGVLCYHVKWLNFPEEDNTWEPADNLDCAKLISAYDALHPHPPSTRSTTRTAVNRVPDVETIEAPSHGAFEAITGHRVRQGSIQYRVRRVGCKQEKWYPRENYDFPAAAYRSANGL